MERWVVAPDNPNYTVSDNGRVRRLGQDRDKSAFNKHGYLNLDLYHNGVRKHELVHRLVAKAFVPNPDNKPVVNHKDGNKLNNNADNLEWVTSLENNRHAWKNGLMRPSYSMRGRKNPNAGRKGKPIRIVETGEVFKDSLECEKKIGGNNRHINDCLKGRQKTHRGYHFEYVDN